MQISTALNNSRLTGVLSFLAGGTVLIYGGTQPDFGEAADSDALVTVTLASPAGTVADGVLTLSASDSVMVSNDGTATWARVQSSDGTHGFDCAVSDESGDGPLKLSAVELYAGGYLSIASGSLT